MTQGLSADKLQKSHEWHLIGRLYHYKKPSRHTLRSVSAYCSPRLWIRKLPAGGEGFQPRNRVVCHQPGLDTSITHLLQYPAPALCNIFPDGFCRYYGAHI